MQSQIEFNSQIPRHPGYVPPFADLLTSHKLTNQIKSQVNDLQVKVHVNDLQA